MGIDKNTAVFRPSAEQLDTAIFRAIVGDPKYTPGGQLKGAIFDGIDGGCLEIKGGYGELNSTCQLRLQTYKATIDSMRCNFLLIETVLMFRTLSGMVGLS